MILERPATYWSVGIILTWHPQGARDHNGNKTDGWTGEVEYYDDGFADDDTDAGKISTQGVLRTRYAVADGTQQTALSAIVDTLIADAGRLGIQFRTGDGVLPRLYVPGDGEWDDHPLPDGWQDLLAAEAARIGWSAYGTNTARHANRRSHTMADQPPTVHDNMTHEETAALIAWARAENDRSEAVLARLRAELEDS